MATAAKILGVAPASISKVCGVAKANVKYVMGVELAVPAASDSYEATPNDGWGLYTTTSGTYAVGQMITLPSCVISKMAFNLMKTGSPTGTVAAILCAKGGGTVGTDAYPVMTPSATSPTVNASSLTTSYQWIEFTFSSPISVSAGAYYIGCYSSAGDSNHRVIAGMSTVKGHSGNMATMNKGSPDYAVSQDYADLNFRVY